MHLNRLVPAKDVALEQGHRSEAVSDAALRSVYIINQAIVPLAEAGRVSGPASAHRNVCWWRLILLRPKMESGSMWPQWLRLLVQD